MTATVTKLPKSSAAKAVRRRAASLDAAPKPVRRPNRAARRQLMAGTSVMAVAAVLTGLSLSHLAHGIAVTTGTGSADAWSMAVGVDLGFIALEGAMLTASAKSRPAVEKWAGPTVKALMVMSAAMNAFAFASTAPNGIYAAIAAAWGIAIPCIVYAAVRSGFAMVVPPARTKGAKARGKRRAS